MNPDYRELGADSSVRPDWLPVPRQVLREWSADLSACPDWTAEFTSNKIRRFQLLPHGWHQGEGIPLDPKVARFAEGLLAQVRYAGLSDVDVFPRPNGGLEFHVYGPHGHVELFINQDGTFDYLRNDVNDEITGDGEGLPWEKAIRLIKEFFAGGLAPFEQSHPSPDTSRRSGDFPLMYSGIPATIRVCQSSTNAVRWPQVVPSVGTFRSITQVR